MSTTWALIISAVLLALNGFFVAAEFSLVASKRHRLEEAAASGSLAARAALAGVSELSLMLAGAQLGITVTTLVIGFIAEPAIAALIEPGLRTLGLSDSAAFGVAFALAFDESDELPHALALSATAAARTIALATVRFTASLRGLWARRHRIDVDNSGYWPRPFHVSRDLAQ